MLTQDSAEELNQNDDDMSCVTGVTCTTGTTFRHAVDEAPSESKTKQTAAASGHLQYFMFFLGGFGTYLGQHVKNKLWQRFLWARKKLQRRVI